MRFSGLKTLGIAAVGSTGLAMSANAASVGFSLDDGADLTINVLLTEVGSDLQFKVEVAPGGDIADLRGVFFHVVDESALGSMSATGTDLNTDGGHIPFEFSANSVNDLGNGANMNGATGSPFDAGIEIGTSGASPDDIQSTEFLVLNLSLADLFNQAFGIRATSVGPVGGGRGGSVKLTSTVPPGQTVPTPAAAGMGLALLGLGALRRTRRQTV